MPYALRQLMMMQFQGLLRRGMRQVRTPRGALFVTFGVVACLLWLGSAVMAAQLERPRTGDVRNVLPLILLGVTLLTTLTSAGEKAIAFTGGEVDLLFPAPFTRRQLLVFKTVKGVFVTALSSIVISLAISRNATHWLACYVGVVLALLFVQFAGTAAMLVAQAVGDRFRGRGRLIAWAIVAVAVIWAASSAAGPKGWDELSTNPRAVLQRFAETEAGSVLLAPFKVLSRVITARQLWPELPIWAAAAAAMDLALLGVVLALDAGFVEAAAGASERRYERMRRMRTGGALAASIGSGPARRGLPMLPRLGGAGPVAWRQLSHAFRAGRSLLIVLLVLAAAVGPLVVVAARQKDVTQVMINVLAALAWISVLLAGVLRFDFRSDLDAMDTLKSLPMSPMAMAAGQLVAPTLVMTAIHWVVVAATVIMTARQPSGDEIRPLMFAAAAVALPFNLLMFAAENLIFLLAPSRPTGAGPGDFSMLGRQIFTLVIRTVGVTAATVIAVAIAFVVHHVSPPDVALPLAVVTAMVVLAAEGAAAVPLVAMAFRRFDPSVHMPG